MGLLHKAASGGSKQDNIQKDEIPYGGLLKLISNKQQQDVSVNSVNTNKKKAVPSSPLEKAIMEKISSCYKKFGIFQCVVIEALKYSAGEFTGRLSFMVSGFGIAQGLAPGRALVIFNSTQDCELLGKHLAKTVPGKNIANFLANTPEEAFSFIKQYL